MHKSNLLVFFSGFTSSVLLIVHSSQFNEFTTVFYRHDAYHIINVIMYDEKLEVISRGVLFSFRNVNVSKDFRCVSRS